jgi:hypothetical protein
MVGLHTWGSLSHHSSGCVQWCGAEAQVSRKLGSMVMITIMMAATLTQMPFQHT